MNKELDCFIIGFSVGALAFLWVGYRLRVRVERWQARSQARAHQHALGPARRGTPRDAAKSIPFDGSNLPASYAQDTKRVLAEKPRLVPLKRRDLESPTLRQPKRVPISVIPIGEALVPDLHWSNPSTLSGETAQMIYKDALAALTSAGYKHRDAEAALDACTAVERAGGLESWVAAALRRAAAKP